MRELIERQAAIDALMDAVKKVGVLDADDIKAVFDMQPTIQPEAYWIPVSERLPEEPGYYITSNEYNGVGEDFYYDGHFWNADKNAYSVIAWMPLPEAYKPNK